VVDTVLVNMERGKSHYCLNTMVDRLSGVQD